MKVKKIRDKYLPDYFETIDWLEFYKGIEEGKPLIMIFATLTGKIEKVLLRRGSPSGYKPLPIDDKIKQEPLLTRHRKEKLVLTEKLIEEFKNEKEDELDEKQTIASKEIQEENPPNVVIDSNGSVSLPEEMPSSLNESKEGIVEKGRWVEFKEGSAVKIGKIEWISENEKEFLVKPKGEPAHLVEDKDLLSLIPNID